MFKQYPVYDLSIELSDAPCASSGPVMLQYSGFHQLIMEYRGQDCIHYPTVVNADKKEHKHRTLLTHTFQKFIDIISFRIGIKI